MIAWFGLCLSVGTFAAEPAPVEAIVSVSLMVAVAHPDAVAETLIARAETEGGWFRSRAPTEISLAVPFASYPALLSLAEEQGLVLGKSISRVDASQELAELRGRLASRESLLADYEGILKSASSDAVLTVESQMSDAITQIETLRGRIQMLEAQTAHARLDISFQFRDRSAPASSGLSSFRWLNTLNIQEAQYSLLRDQSRHESRAVTIAEPPAGFAAWKKRKSYRAIAPDSVLFRVRSVKQKPPAPLEFWKEAVRGRMQDAGYTVLSESEISASGQPGALIALAAPMGTEDWLYWVAFFPVGNRIVIAEAAGEITAFETHREAIATAVRGIELSAR